MSTASSEFVLILQQVDGKLEVAGVQKPEKFDAAEVPHVFGQWLQNNLPQMLSLAMAEARAKAAPPETVVGPDRERTLVLPDGC